MDTTKAELITRKHMHRVAILLNGAAAELINRAVAHDLSKLLPDELIPLQQMQDIEDKEGKVPFGSDEYKKRLEILKPMLEHHYNRNSHHPEHYQNGVNGMDLFDLIEMFLDWKAASERGGESSMNLAKAAERFGISDQLLEIMQNTATRAGWKHL